MLDSQGDLITSSKFSIWKGTLDGGSNIMKALTAWYTVPEEDENRNTVWDSGDTVGR